MEILIYFTRADLFNPKFYPKACKLRQNQTCQKNCKQFKIKSESDSTVQYGTVLKTLHIIVKHALLLYNTTQQVIALLNTVRYCITAGGPQGKWMENRLEKTDSPISSPEAKKSYLRVKKSRTLALRDLITPRRLTNSRQQSN